MSNMFTNPRDEQYMHHVTRNMGDGMSEQQTKDAAAAWNKAFKTIPPKLHAGFTIAINPSGSLTFSGHGGENLTMTYEEFTEVAKSAISLYAQFSNQEETLQLRGKPE